MQGMWIHDLSLFGRIALAALLGFVVGWEREVRGHPAGARTFSLVSAGAAALTTIASDAYPLTAEKLIAGVVTGVGFIGAGVVLRDPHGHVQGLTTASAIWATTAIGVMSGSARFVLGAATCALYVFLLEVRSIPGLRRIDPRRWAHLFSNETDAYPETRPKAGPSSSDR